MAKIQWEQKVMEKESVKRMSEVEGKRNRPQWPRFSGNRKLWRKNQRKECQK